MKMIRRHLRDVNSSNIRRQLQDEIILFITQDYCKVTNGMIDQTNKGDTLFLRVGQSRRNELRKCFLDVSLQDMSNVEVTNIQLCLYQYYSDSDASSTDLFSLHTFNDVWSEDEDISPNYGNTIANDFTFPSSSEGQQCINIDVSHLETLRKSTGVVLEGKAVGNKKERYFMSSEWTSHSKNITEGIQSRTYHPHWMIKTREIEELPSAFPTISINTDATAINKESSDGYVPIPFQNKGSITLMIITSLLAFCCLILMAIIFVRRRHKDKSNAKRFRTFVTQDDLERKDKFSFSSLNSSNKASSGCSSRSNLKWIESVDLENAGGDRTICDNIDQKIDDAALPSFEEPDVSSRRMSSTTPKQRNNGTSFDYLGANSIRKGIFLSPKHEPVSAIYDHSKNEAQKTWQMTKIDEEQDSIQRLKERIHARRHLAHVKYPVEGRDIDSIIDSKDGSYPSLFSSSEEEEDMAIKKTGNCLDEMIKEYEKTKKDAEKLWKEGFSVSKSNYTHPTTDTNEESSAETSTYASTLTYPYM